MKILLTCDPEIPVPPDLYGGIERIVDGLARGYSALGHQVYLIAHPDSSCNHTIENFAWPALKSNGFRNIFLNGRYLKKVVNITKPDVIHSFSRLLYLYPIFDCKDIKFIQSYQRGISKKSTQLASFLAGSKLIFTACGGHMLKNLPNKSKFEVIYNFTDTQFFNLVENSEFDYLAFLGRIEDIKGTAEAIEVAIRTNEKLIIAGNIQEGHEKYFDEKIKPYLSHPLIQYVGSVNNQQKRELLQGAKALLFPIKWEEPFGIVMAESLSCGTPVIGFNRGSVQEVVEDGQTGFIVENIEEMIERVKKLNLIDRKKCNLQARNRFELRIIAKQYSHLHYIGKEN